MRHCRKGFTLIEIIITLAIVSVLAGVIMPMSYQLTNRERVNRTLDKLDALARAVTGDPVIVFNEARTNFGYVGDMGNLPSSIEDLYKKGTQPDFVFDTTLEVGAGWNGPYISPEIVEYIDLLKEDAFGNDYEYIVYGTDTTNTTVGAVVEGMIRSPGADDESGTGDDLSLLFFRSQLKSKVSGVVKNEALDGVGGVTVTMNYPSDGDFATMITETDTHGFYTFDNVPYGNRSLTLAPNLVVTAGSVKISNTQGNNVQLSVTNFSASDININTVTIGYSVAAGGTASYGTLIIKGDTFSLTDAENGSIESPSSPPITVAGGLGAIDTIPIRIQSPVTDVDDVLPVAMLGRGEIIQIDIKNFRDDGGAIDMEGVPMTITFNDDGDDSIIGSDESVIRFTPF